MSDDEPTTRGTEAARWRRVLLKLSGEAFAGPLEHGIHGPTVRAIAEDIVAAARQFNVDLLAHGDGETVDFQIRFHAHRLDVTFWTVDLFHQTFGHWGPNGIMIAAKQNRLRESLDFLAAVVHISPQSAKHKRA